MFWSTIKQYWWIVAGLVITIWILFNYQRSKRLQEEIKAKQSEETSKLKTGLNVILDSGMHGVIREIKENSLMIEIAPGVIAEFERYGVIFSHIKDTPKERPQEETQEMKHFQKNKRS